MCQQKQKNELIKKLLVPQMSDYFTERLLFVVVVVVVVVAVQRLLNLKWKLKASMNNINSSSRLVKNIKLW